MGLLTVLARLELDYLHLQFFPYIFILDFDHLCTKKKNINSETLHVKMRERV